MKCPTCVAEGKRSTVGISRARSQTRAAEQYWDEDGRYHDHEDTRTEFTYRCRNGHEWTEVRPIDACWCGWPLPEPEPWPLEVKTEASDVVVYGPGVPSEPGAAAEFRANEITTWNDTQITPDADDDIVHGSPPFRMLDAFKVADREPERLVLVVELDRKCTDFDWLIGHRVVVDGVVHRCIAVDAFCLVSHSPGEKIGIAVPLVDDAEADPATP